MPGLSARSKTYTTLWKITGLVAAGLFIATIILAYQAHHMPQTGIYAKLTSPNPTIYLREEPASTGKILTILERGSTVYVIDIVTNQEVRWMKVESGHFTGWVPATNIVFEGQ